MVAVEGKAWTKALQLTGRNNLENQKIAVREGEKLYVYADLDASGSANAVGFGLYMRASNGDSIAFAYAPLVPAHQAWTRVGAPIAIQVGVAYVHPFIVCDTAALGGPVLAANLYIGRADLGATVGAPAGTYVGNQLAENLVSTAAAAASSASDAATAAASALTQLTAIASDNVLSAGEKPDVILDYTVITNERAGIDAQAVSYGVVTEALAYDASIAALTSYLGSLSTPTAWNNLSGNTSIVGTDFRAAFSNVYAARQAVLNSITHQAQVKIANAGTLSLVTRGNAVLDGNTVSKVSGVAAWDSDAFSTSGYTGGAYASVTASRVTDSYMFGLNTDPTTDQSYGSIDYAIFVRGDGQWQVYESGVSIPATEGYAAGDSFVVTYDGATVRYLRNGALFRAVAAASGLRLFFDSSLYSVGALMSRISFGPLSDISGALSAAATASTAAATAQGAADAALSQLGTIASDNVLSAGEKPDVILDYTVITNERAGIDAQASSYGVTTEAVAYDAAIAALGTYLGSLSTPTAWNNLTGNTTIVGADFRTAFANVYSARQTVLNAITHQAQLKIAAAATLTLLARGNAVVDGSTITKVGGVNAWDCDAYSKSGYIGGAFTSATAMSVDKSMMFGLNSDPTTDQSYGSIDFAIFLRGDSQVSIFESGASVADCGSYATGDSFAVTYDGTAVRYFHNGTVIRSLPASAGLTLSFDSSLYDPGVSISNVQFGPLTDLSAAMAAAASAATSATNAQNSADSALVALSSIASDNVLSAGEKPAVILDYTVLSGEQSGIDTQATTYSISTEKVAYDASVSALTAYLNSLVTPTAWNNLAGDTTINGPNFRSVFSSVYSSRQALLNAIAIAAKNRLGALATLNTVGTSIIEPNAATDVYTATASNVTITGVRGTPNTIGKFTSLASVTFTAQVTGDVLFQAEAPCVVTTSTSYPYASLNSVIAMNSVVTGPSSTYASNANIGYSQTLNVTIFRTRRLSVVAGTAYTIELLAQGNDASVSLVATDVQIRVEVIKR